MKSSGLTVSIVHDNAVRRVVKDSLCSWPIHLIVALKNILTTTIRTARTRGIDIRASNSTTPTSSHFILSASSRLGSVIAIRLSFTPEQVVVVTIQVNRRCLGIVVSRWLILDVVGGSGCDSERLGPEGDLVDVLPVGAKGEVVGPVDLVHGGVYSVVGRATF